MKYEAIKKSAIYMFIVVTVAMTLLGVMAIWFPYFDDVVGKAVSTILVVGFGSLVTGYSASLLETKSDSKEALPSFAPHPKPVPPATDHIAQGK